MSTENTIGQVLLGELTEADAVFFYLVRRDGFTRDWLEGYLPLVSARAEVMLRLADVPNGATDDVAKRKISDWVKAHENDPVLQEVREAALPVLNYVLEYWDAHSESHKSGDMCKAIKNYRSLRDRLQNM